MRKLTLDLDTLAVESFEAETHPAGYGSVAAHAATYGGCNTNERTCIDPTCAQAETCWFGSCAGSRCDSGPLCLTYEANTCDGIATCQVSCPGPCL